MTGRFLTGVLLAGGVALAAAPLALAQTAPPAQQHPDAEQTETAGGVAYKPPLRGAPGGRVGGASRSASAPRTKLPVIELLAPAEHAGITASADPTLYFFVSAPVSWPMQLTISAPLQPDPVIEVTIPSPRAAGLYAVRPADHRVHLRPGTVYTWSVSILIDPRAWSRNIVASATLMVDPTLAAAPPPATTPAQRVGYLAQAGLWYDAVAAAMQLPPRDDPLTLQPLMRQVGLDASAAFRRAAATQ